MYAPFFHVGMVVDDLEAEMDRLGSSLGLNWAKVQHADMGVTVDGERVTRSISFVYSTNGPPYVELISTSEAPWVPTEGVHHIGVWTDDVAGGLQSLMGQGYRLAARGRGFAYLVTPVGGMIELVDTRSRPAFDRWMAGGDYL